MRKTLIRFTCVAGLACPLSCAGADQGVSDQPPLDEPIVAAGPGTGGESITNAQKAPSADRLQLCEMITVGDIAAIVGGAYIGVEQQADYATLAHCRYIGAAGGGNVSILYALGDHALTRWEAARKAQVIPVADFWDVAIWEAATGTITATKDDMLAEVGVSESLVKDPQEQVEHAKQLADLVAARTRTRPRKAHPEQTVSKTHDPTSISRGLVPFRPTRDDRAANGNSDQ